MPPSDSGLAISLNVASSAVKTFLCDMHASSITKTSYSQIRRRIAILLAAQTSSIGASWLPMSIGTLSVEWIVPLGAGSSCAAMPDDAIAATSAPPARSSSMSRLSV
jgi:hypothetical protein